MIVAGFPTELALRQALLALQKEHVRIETYTPGKLDETEPDSTVSPLSLVMLGAGLIGGFGFFGLQAYADVYAYPINIGGRPDFSWPVFIVNAFEFGVLCALVAGLAGYFMANRMPKLYEPVDECDGLREASRDGWFLSVEGGEPARVRALLDSAGPVVVQEVKE